jgi:hypothetical protein
MKEYIPIFENFNKKQDLFYFDKINEELSDEELLKELANPGPKRNAKEVTDYANKASVRLSVGSAKFEEPSHTWLPSELGKSVIASLEGFVSGNKNTTGHQATGFGINLSVHSNYKLIEPGDYKGAFEQMDEFIKNELVAPFNKWVKYYNYVLNQNMADALYSFAYNLGPAKLESLTKGKSEPAGTPFRHEGILADGMSLYTAGKYSDGLKKRRAVEVAMYDSLIKGKEDFWKFSSNSWYDYKDGKKYDKNKQIQEPPSTGSDANGQTPTSAQPNA